MFGTAIYYNTVKTIIVVTVSLEAATCKSITCLYLHVSIHHLLWVNKNTVCVRVVYRPPWWLKIVVSWLAVLLLRQLLSRIWTKLVALRRRPYPPLFHRYKEADVKEDWFSNEIRIIAKQWMDTIACSRYDARKVSYSSYGSMKNICC